MLAPEPAAALSDLLGQPPADPQNMNASATLGDVKPRTWQN